MVATQTLQNYQKYRPDIDGLRAVAVLSVILFHIDESLIPGGFVGVDIFFVISGYLISLHIFRDLDNNKFSLVEFYRRRVKRIAPAMLVVVAVTLLISQVILRPVDAEKVANSGLWSILSLANVYFWLYQDTSYFAAASRELPLLHLWSLGVEEQFYIFWPIILMSFYKITRLKIFVILLILFAISSFLMAEYLSVIMPAFSYYMLPTRAGELLLGAIAALVVMKQGTRSVPVYIIELCGIIGGLLVLGSLFMLSEEDVFPGIRAIPPTLGTVIIILSGHYGKNILTRLLMLKPMIWVGVISYSAYLWHWPILSFYYYSQPEMSKIASISIFLLTILLARLSYIYIETPARHSSKPAFQIFKNQFFIPAGILIIIALASMKLDGYGFRWLSSDYKSSLSLLKEETKPAYKYPYVCQRQKINTDDLNNKNCVIGTESGSKPKTLLWGDSNAAHYIGMLGGFALNEGFEFMNLEVGSCPPIYSDPVRFVSAKRLSDCRDSINNIWNTLDDYEVIIISANWSDYQSKSDQFIDVFFDTINKLLERGKLVVLLGKIPVISTYDRLCREKAISLPFMNCNVENVSVSDDIKSVNFKLNEFSLNTKNVEYYDITNYLCPKGVCSAYNDRGMLLYYDSSHLTLSASWQLGRDIIKQDGVPLPFRKVNNWLNTLN